MMMRKRQGNTMQRMALLIGTVVSVFILMPVSVSHAGTYLDSAHGNSSTGVDRDVAGISDYAIGNCAHCHEQHGSIGDSEPTPPPASGPSLYLLFDDNHPSSPQTNNLCLKCHTGSGSVQTGTGSMTNRSYSYTAGGWTADPVDDIFEQFSATSTSSHNLDDILTEITGKWGYTADSNPCAACHNPHAAKNAWPVSLPNKHDDGDNNAWGLWGDDAGERMNVYAPPSTYQAPYRFNSSVLFEPDGSLTQDGSNLTDYVTFCTDCHDNTNIITSTTLGRNLNTFDWNADKHGKGSADDGVPPPPAGFADPSTCTEIRTPYQSGTCGSYVLACTDCHEPHGSPNIYLIRKEVNKAVVTVTTDTTAWINLCDKCHNIAIGDARHDHPAVVPGGAPSCSGPTCHGPLSNQYPVCSNCHNHGNNNIVDFFGTTIGVWGDQLF